MEFAQSTLDAMDLYEITAKEILQDARSILNLNAIDSESGRGYWFIGNIEFCVDCHQRFAPIVYVVN